MIRALRKKAAALAPLLETEQSRALLEEFVVWVIERDSTHILLGRLPHIVGLLARIEQSAAPMAMLTEDRLFGALTTEEIRRSGLLALFLGERGLLTRTNRERAEMSERRRIRDMLESVRGKRWGERICAYAAEIADPGAALSPRTQRVYVRAAIELMNAAGVETVAQLADEHIRKFLRQRPGHRASLSRWLSVINQTMGRTLSLPARLRKRPPSVTHMAGEVRSLVAAADRSASSREQLALLAKLLATLYGVPLEHILALAREDLDRVDHAVRLRLGDQWITIAPPIDQLVTKIVAGATQGQQSSKLFPGRLPDDGLSVAAVQYYVRRAKPRE